PGDRPPGRRTPGQPPRAAPPRGGVGAVEATLTVGLIAVGLPKEVAAPAVLLFRLLTLWLPVLPGWLAFNHLTRKQAL
ncbi:lysylphosphatidylglycerol synthase domain-containing protein, partial [Streptomyces collinus]